MLLLLLFLLLFLLVTLFLFLCSSNRNCCWYCSSSWCSAWCWGCCFFSSGRYSWTFFWWEGFCRLPSPPRHLVPNTVVVGGLIRPFRRFRCCCCWVSLWRRVFTGVRCAPRHHMTSSNVNHTHPFFRHIRMLGISERLLRVIVSWRTNSPEVMPALLIIAETSSTCAYQTKKALILSSVISTGIPMDGYYCFSGAHLFSL